MHVTATAHVANPLGGDPLAPGQSAEVNETDPDVAALIKGGYLVPADEGTDALPLGDPDESWTKADLLRAAADRGVTIPDNATKAEILDALGA